MEDMRSLGSRCWDCDEVSEINGSKVLREVGYARVRC